MSAAATIEKVLDSGLLIPDLTIIPPRGATEDEIDGEEAILGRRLCPDHAVILRRWNGIALDIIRLFGCGDTTGEIGRLANVQIKIDLELPGGIVVGADASGYAYIQSNDARVFSLDTDGGELKLMAHSMDDFIDRVVFGLDAASFAGQDWLVELRERGIIA